MDGWMERAREIDVCSHACLCLIKISCGGDAGMLMTGAGGFCCHCMALLSQLPCQITYSYHCGTLTA